MTAVLDLDAGFNDVFGPGRSTNPDLMGDAAEALRALLIAAYPDERRLSHSLEAAVRRAADTNLSAARPYTAGMSRAGKKTRVPVNTLHALSHPDVDIAVLADICAGFPRQLQPDGVTDITSLGVYDKQDRTDALAQLLDVLARQCRARA